MRDETLCELNRIACWQVGPLGTGEARELSEIFEVNSRHAGLSKQAVPDSRPRCRGVFAFQFTADRKATWLEASSHVGGTSFCSSVDVRKHVSPFYGFGFGEEAGVAALTGLAAFAGVAVAVALFTAGLAARGALFNASTTPAVKSMSSRA